MRVATFSRLLWLWCRSLHWVAIQTHRSSKRSFNKASPTTRVRALAPTILIVEAESAVVAVHTLALVDDRRNAIRAMLVAWRSPRIE